MLNKGIWFGKLADGTEASICDLIMQECTVVQAARVRLVDRSEPLGYEETLAAAQNLRQRFPELNREETPSLYSEARFSRKTLSEEDASAAVTVTVADASCDTRECRKETLTCIQKHIMKHPSSLSRLGWRIDVLWNRDGSDVVAWILFSVSHTHSDGVGMQQIINYYLDAYLLLLQDKTLEKPQMLPLYSALPRDRVPLSNSSKAVYGVLGWLASKVMGKPGSPEPKLLTAEMKENANTAKKARKETGKSQYAGPMQVGFIELDKSDTQLLCGHARSMGLTVGALVHSALFLAIAKRYFREHATKSSLSLDIPMSVNMRGFLQPPLPDTVLAPQQGEVMVHLKTTRSDVEVALGSDKAMSLLLSKIAMDSRSQIQKNISKPEKLAPLDSNIFLASLFRNGLGKMGTVQYIGDAWLSNVGLFRPTKSLEQASNFLSVESTFTLNPTIVPAYELVWCNSVVGGCMALSMVTDETMGRTQASSHALLSDASNLLKALIR